MKIIKVDDKFWEMRFDDHEVEIINAKRRPSAKHSLSNRYAESHTKAQ